MVGLRRRLLTRNGDITLAFFHPFAEAGGGGERVLWAAIEALRSRLCEEDKALVRCCMYDERCGIVWC